MKAGWKTPTILVPHAGLQYVLVIAYSMAMADALASGTPAAGGNPCGQLHSSETGAQLEESPHRPWPARVPDVCAANNGIARFRICSAAASQADTFHTKSQLEGLMRIRLGTAFESIGLHLFDLHNVRMHQLFMVDDLPLHILADLHTAPMLLRVLGRTSYSDLQEDSPVGDVLHLEAVKSRGTWW